LENTMEMKTYRVLRDHIGDEGKLYSPHGESSTREANPNDVAHLVGKTLELIEDAPAPADAPAATKAPAKKSETAAPENKADAPAATKEA
jgi:hypothetical protein